MAVHPVREVNAAMHGAVVANGQNCLTIVITYVIGSVNRLLGLCCTNKNGANKGRPQ
jgi:hypothetical protein